MGLSYQLDPVRPVRLHFVSYQANPLLSTRSLIAVVALLDVVGHVDAGLNTRTRSGPSTRMLFSNGIRQSHPLFHLLAAGSRSLFVLGIQFVSQRAGTNNVALNPRRSAPHSRSRSHSQNGVASLFVASCFLVPIFLRSVKVPLTSATPAEAPGDCAKWAGTQYFLSPLTQAHMSRKL